MSQYWQEEVDWTTPIRNFIAQSYGRNTESGQLFLRARVVPALSAGWVYNKILKYVKTFTKFNTTDSASAVRDTLRREPALTQFETAQIANLCPAAADEAKSVIPSLVKIDDDRLEALLRDIQTMRKYHVPHWDHRG